MDQNDERSLEELLERVKALDSKKRVALMNFLGVFVEPDAATKRKQEVRSSERLKQLKLDDGTPVFLESQDGTRRSLAFPLWDARGVKNHFDLPCDEFLDYSAPADFDENVTPPAIVDAHLAQLVAELERRRRVVLRHGNYGSLNDETRREFISCVLLAAADHFDSITHRCARDLHGVAAHGTVDYTAQRRYCRGECVAIDEVPITFAKMEDLTDGLRENYLQLEASYDAELLWKNSLKEVGLKKACELGIVTTGRAWLVTRFRPEARRKVSCMQQRSLAIDQDKPIDSANVREILELVIRVLAASQQLVQPMT
eukprot:TRINITY_DN3618_c0_g2_i2.p1 TRINITY_DN3618_c0_g2~~TRINITY_DN3618_c0_g2_i2.p1  ORF type:complete len:314 (-),score=48.40 TRINITY_DN3618_c0_g2_i2:227-1168(-)